MRNTRSTPIVPSFATTCDVRVWGLTWVPALSEKTDPPQFYALLCTHMQPAIRMHTAGYHDSLLHGSTTHSPPLYPVRGHGHITPDRPSIIDDESRSAKASRCWIGNIAWITIRRHIVDAVEVAAGRGNRFYMNTRCGGTDGVVVRSKTREPFSSWALLP